jgi:hypothetical protein
MCRRRALALVLVFTGSFAAAADRPIGARKLLLRDGADTAARKIKFKAASEAALTPGLVDPTASGATLQVFGAGPGDGATGVITLPAAFWTGLGTPPGAKGWRFLDPLVGTGVKKVVFRSGAAGGTLVVSGGRGAWPYAVTQPQTAVELRFGSGGEAWCAHFSTFAVNQPGKVLGRNAAAPAGCTPHAGQHDDDHHHAAGVRRRHRRRPRGV